MIILDRVIAKVLVLVHITALAKPPTLECYPTKGEPMIRRMDHGLKGIVYMCI